MRTFKLLISRLRRRCSLAAVVVLVGGCICVETRIEQVTSNTDLVTFDVPIPHAPASLPLYELSALPIEGFGREKFNQCPGPALSTNQAAGAQTAPMRAPPARPACYSDPKTGEIEIFPNLEPRALTPPSDAPNTRAMFEAGKKFLQEEAGIAEDMSIGGARLLRRARAYRNNKAESQRAAEPALMYIPARRLVDGYRVDGPGSRAAVMMGMDGIRAGFTRSWKRRKKSSEIGAPDPQRVRAAIERQLSATRPHSRVRVQFVEIAYYNGDALLQPVYRFIAEFGREPGALGDSEHVVGYVPFAATAETIPELADEVIPTVPPTLDPPAASAEAALTHEVRVGRYFARNERTGWVTDAVDFWDALAAQQRGIRFVDSQLLPTFPVHFTTDSHKFVDSVEIALVEAHGAPLQFATDRNCCDRVRIGGDGFPSSGYGPTQGKLKHWLLHSCEVVPGPNENSNWAEPWWPVFENGLYSVAGYRSPMYIHDGAGAAVGRRVALGEPIVSAWMTAVATLNVYGLNPHAQFSCDGRKAMGKPSVISACGAHMAAAGDTVEVTPDCLDAWWIEDADIQE